MAHSGDVREQLINASINLFGRYGYRDVSIDSITKEASVTKGSFYYYFADKESLLYLIHDQFISYELDRAIQAYESSDGPKEKLVRFIEDLLTSIAIYKPNVTIFFRDRHFLSKENMNLIKQKRDQYESILIQILEDGRQQGVFEFDNSKIAALGIFGMCNWVYQWFHPDGGLSISDIAQQFVGLITQGIVPPQT